MTDRFASFTGWELQCLARGVQAVENASIRSEQEEAQRFLMDEIHQEFEQREDQGFSDPAAVRRNA